jgi:nucleoid-associated protein YgaU
MFLEAIATRRARLALASLTPQKAKIRNLEKGFLDPSSSIEVSFNPSSIKFAAATDFPQVNNPDSDDGYRMFYSGTIPTTLDMDLLFDTTITGDDVREKYIDFLLDLTRPDPDSDPPQPPRCRFTWGEFAEFEGVLVNLRVNYTFFLPNGRPVRAEVDLTIKKPDEATGGTNPTSRSEARRVWTVVQGQTLDWIAYQEYGDASAWRHIARVNNLTNPRALKPGMVLKLTPLR